MARKYKAIKQYYEKMEQQHQEGYSCREIGEKFGFTKEQKRILKRRGRPAKETATILSALEKVVRQL